MSGPGLSLPFTPLPFLVSPQQRQDKAALISETRRRFEAEYLPGERVVGPGSVDVVSGACPVSFFTRGLHVSPVSHASG